MVSRMSRQWRVILISTVLMVGGLPASANELFVIHDGDSSVSNIGSLSRSGVPVYKLDVSEAMRLVDAMNVALEAEVPAETNEENIHQRWPAIEAIFKRIMSDGMNDLSRAVGRVGLAGEIRLTYNIRQLPALVHVRKGGYEYRVVEGVSNMNAALEQIEKVRFEQRASADTPVMGDPGLLVGKAGRESVHGKGSYEKKQLSLSDWLYGDSHKNNDRRGAASLFNQAGRILSDFVPNRNGKSEAPVTPSPTSPSTPASPSGGSVLPSATTSYSMLEALTDGMTAPSCLSLNITGVCSYTVLRVNCGWTGCSFRVSLEGSIELKHGNPEVVTAVYKRLGGTPIEEGSAFLSGVLNIFAGRGLELIHGEPVPDNFDDEDQTGGWLGESRGPGERTVMKYNEVMSIGHPGTLLSYMSAENPAPIDLYTQALLRAPLNLAGGLRDSGDQVATSLQRGASAVASVAGNPEGVLQSGDGVGAWQMPSGDEMVEMAEGVLEGGLATAATALLALTPEIQALLDAYGTVMDLQSILDAIEILQDPGGALNAQMTQVLEDFQAILDQLNALQSTFASIGLGVGGGTEMWSMCPTAGKFMLPYHLSGADFVQWRFNIPGLIHWQTYAPPLPPFKDYFVGQLDFSAGLPTAWGPVYPRQGWVQGADNVKVNAVTASRSAHVFTRPAQFGHVYNYLKPAEKADLTIQHPPEFNPTDATSGKWRPLTPDKDDECYVFGQDDSMFAPWSQGRQSDDGAHVYTLWRTYTCCPRPRRGGADFFDYVTLPHIPLDIPLIQ